MKNQLQMIKRILTLIIIDYSKYVTDKMKAQTFKLKVPSSISQQVLSQKIMTAKQKTKDNSVDEKTVINTTSNAAIKDNSIQSSDSKTEEDTKLQLDLQQHECINDKDKNDLLNRATKKAKLITGESVNTKVGNNIPESQKTTTKQFHMDDKIKSSQSPNKKIETATQTIKSTGGPL